MKEQAPLPFSAKELFVGNRVRTFTGESLAQVAFPLGGIGTGTISLGGRGNLRDWEIWNRPSKGCTLPMTFFALWAQRAGGPPLARVLERRYLPPYLGAHGFDRTNLSGLPRLDEAVFRGEYPFAWIQFADAALPVRVRLEAFTPFVPLDADASGVPVAVLNWTVENRSSKQVQVSLLATMHNPVGFQDIGVPTQPFPARLNQYRESEAIRGLWFTAPELGATDPNYGTAALVTPWKDLDVQTHLYRGGWWDAAHILWDDFAADGRLKPCIESTYRPGERPGGATPNAETGALALRATIEPRSSETISVMISWLFPHMKAWTDGIIVRTRPSHLFRDAWHAAEFVQENIEELTGLTRRFHKAFFSTTLPGYVLDAVSSQVSTIRTQTCIRLADGQFYGWEGCHDQSGCCSGTCMHVWNYAQTLAFLFPLLERSIRRNEFLNCASPDGHVQFRSSMPANTRMERFHAAADGQMGAIIRAYRDWQLSGDEDFLRAIWPELKRALEYAWTPGGWDADRDGIMEGVQHNTYDVEFYGPNPLTTILYLGALRAAERMAIHLGEDAAAQEYRKVFESGRKRIDSLLWNGEYYVQKVTVPEDASVPDHLKMAGCGCESRECTTEEGELKYQVGDGCLSDQLLGQWASHVAGLGHVLSPERARTAMESIFQFNFRSPVGQVHNVQRSYALNDEKGLLICSWPKGGRPALPFPYCDEVWTGTEYCVAAQLIYEGLLKEGLTMVRAARDRHDGLRRNPWDECECGHHYARAMSSWSLLLALSGFEFSAVARRIAFAPKLNAERFRCFWSCGTAWGTFEQNIRGTRLSATLSVQGGEVRLTEVGLARAAFESEKARVADLVVGSAQVVASVAESGPWLAIQFDEMVRLREGQQMRVVVRGARM